MKRIFQAVKLSMMLLALGMPGRVWAEAHLEISRKVPKELTGSLVINAASSYFQFQVIVNISDSTRVDSSLLEFELLVNGLSLSGARMDITHIMPPQKKTEPVVEEPANVFYYETRINWDRDTNSVLLSVKYAGQDSAGYAFTVIRTAPPKKGNLHVLSIGVKQYDLNYTDDDAMAIDQLFRDQQRERFFFNQVNADLLADSVRIEKSEIEKNLILKASREFNKNDLLVVFIASHGVSRDGRVYISSTNPNAQVANLNMDVEHLDLEENILNYFKNLPCPVVVFIDACQSGNPELAETLRDSEEEERTLLLNEALQSLAQWSGKIFLVTASTGTQLSYDINKLNDGTPIGHGAFTYAILEGLKMGKADSGQYGNRDGYITLYELTKFVGVRTPEINRNASPPTAEQHPFYDTTRIDSTRLFPIYLYKIPGTGQLQPPVDFAQQAEYYFELADKIANSFSDDTADEMVIERAYINALSNGISYCARSPVCLPGLYMKYYQRADEYYYIDKYRDALNDLNSSIGLQPDADSNWMSYYFRAKLRSDTSIRFLYELNKAAEDYRLAIEGCHSEEELEYIYTGYTETLLNLDRYSDAIETATEYLDTYEPVLRIFELRGDAWRDSGEYNRAIDDYLWAIDADIYNIRIWKLYHKIGRVEMNIAVSKAMDTVYFRLAEYDLLEALDSWSVSNNYLDGPDRKAELLIDLSRLYYYLDEFENMLLYAQQGAELNGASDAKLSALYNQMGVAGWYLRRRNDAIDWFQKAVDYDPQNQLAQKNLDIVSR